MSLDLRLPLIGDTAGPAIDGVVRGAMTPVPLRAVLSSALTAGTIVAWRKDRGTQDTYKDVSADAIGTLADGFLPWGADADFSAGDELWLAADRDICEVYVDITTSGQWTGTGLEVLESVDGETFQAVTGLVDGSNGLRAAAGVYRIQFAIHAQRKAIAPTFGATKRKYIVLRAAGLTATTVAPKLRRLWAVCPDTQVSYTDLTTTTNGAVTDGAFHGAASSILYTVGQSVVYGLPGLGLGLDVAVWRAVANTRDGVWEYLASDDTWKALQGVADPSAAFEVGPATLGAAARATTVRWTMPSDWTEKALTFAPATVAVAAFWVRFRVTATPTLAPTAPPLVRVRARCFGAANAQGIYHRAATTYRTVTFDAGVAPAAAMTVALVNANTGQSMAYTHPAGVRSSGAVTGQRLDLASPLTIAAGESLLIMHTGGGEAQDVELRLS